MEQVDVLDMLLRELLAENSAFHNLRIPADLSGKRGLLRTLINLRPPDPIRPEILAWQDGILSAESEARGIVGPDALVTVRDEFGSSASSFSDKLVLWKGDITTLAADAIVNAANDRLLGCFIPQHRCIDNAIHSAAGIQLRLACDDLMKEQGHLEPTGQAKITQAYNLPCRYVIHTVGPIIDGAVTPEAAGLLASCYHACLDAAAAQTGIRTLAFCCISTGEFRFPKAQAAGIALRSVREWLGTHPDSLGRVIFNVFTQEDYDEYAALFRAG